MNQHRPSSPSVHWVKSLFGSLGLRLFLWIFAVIIVTSGVATILGIRASSEQWSQTVQKCAQRFSRLIKRSTHHGMLLNRKDDVHYIIQTIAREPEVDGVRVYDKQGVIIFSADADEIGSQVDLRAEACIACHDGSRPLQAVPAPSRVRIIDSGGPRVMGLIAPIENEPECSNAACHAHSPDQTILGVLDVKMSMVAADAGLAAVQRQAIITAVFTALLAGFVSALFIHRLVRRPVHRLIAGTERVSAGHLETELFVEGEDEIADLGRAFNRMTHDLRRAKGELTQWSDKLETRLVEKTDELNRTQRQVVHMEKMASLGKLAATVAHELNNPLAGILNYAKLVERTLREDAAEADQQELGRFLNLIQKEAGRCGSIVRNLLLFARSSGAEFALHSVNAVIDRSLMLVRHHLEMANVTQECVLLEGDDRIVCDADQVEQALVALFVNAVEAMPDGGTLSVAARDAGESVLLTVGDTGVGISEESIPQLFEPFYSTKEKAGASGLGLAVVYGIVQRHHGTISVDSELEHGTRFNISLPRRPELQSEISRKDDDSASPLGHRENHDARTTE